MTVSATSQEFVPRPEFFGPPTPPRDGIEQDLVDVWQEALNIAPIGIDDDFFDLGGDSFAAVAIFSALEGRHAISCPASALVKYRTIRELAQAVEAGPSAVAARPVVALRSGGDKVPLFLIHLRSSHALVAQAAVRRLAEGDRPVYGILASTLDNDPSRYDLKDMARRYADLVRDQRPTGPYIVGGFCLGSHMALEIGRLLRHEGEDVDQVILIDVPRPGSIGLSRRLRYHLSAMFELGLPRTGRYLGDRLSGLRRRLFPRLPLTTIDGRKVVLTADEETLDREELAALTKRFHPQPYDGDASILTSAHFVGLTNDAQLGWRPLLRGRLHAAEIAETHSQIFQVDNAGRLAQALDVILTGRR
jgi:thioesterase domain-containing protein/acyl carrier protein